ncbi:hypothetical protein [uncultured Novosphingobium sp.]|uniref:DUF6841 family protein n=1 Tax=uncultured Novosphingobium sp. TaxID=292277 RepID=UPI003749441B
MPENGAAQEVEALVRRYIELFNADDFVAAFECYRMPFTWLFGKRAVTVNSRDEFLAMMTATKAALVASGLGSSRILDITVRMMDEYVALAGTEVVRNRADGTEMETIGGTYLVHDDGSGWRFVGQGSHSPDAIAPARDL